MLTIENLSYSYGKIKAIDNISLSVNEGEVYSIVGANGAGKSTLMKLIAGVMRPSSGSITYKGAPLPKTTHQVVRSGIMLVPEGRWIFPNLSVKENLLVGGYVQNKANNHEQMERMFEMFPRLKERRNQRAGTLSGGEQQMLAIGRGLMSRPSLLLLDEPSLGLAPLIVNDIFRIIQEIRETGITILLVEQNARKAISIADRVTLLQTGVVVQTATKEEISKNSSIIDAYLGSQRE